MAPFRDEEIVTCFCHKPVNGGAGTEDSTSVAKAAESPLPHTASTYREFPEVLVCDAHKLIVRSRFVSDPVCDCCKGTIHCRVLVIYV